MNLHSARITACIFMTLLALPARAQLYEHQPEAGLTVYSNVRSQAKTAPVSSPPDLPSVRDPIFVPLAEPVAPRHSSSMFQLPRPSGAGRRVRDAELRRKLKDALQHEQFLLDAAIAEGSGASIIRLHREQIAVLLEEIAQSK